MFIKKFIKKNKKLCNNGFTLVEMLVSTAVFLIIAIAAYQGYATLLKGFQLLRVKSTAVALANEQFEIARNLPYADVGTVNGIPSGKLLPNQNLVRDGILFSITTTVRNIDDPYDGTVASSTNTDASPVDSKLVEVSVVCEQCSFQTPIVLTSRIAPLHLENNSANGSLFVKVFDANGKPVQGASVTVTNPTATTAISFTDTTDANGLLQIIDAPPGVGAYSVSVTKNGYSTDQTKIATGGNPNPLKPQATVVAGSVTQTSFAIDQLGSLTIAAVDTSCAAAPSFAYTIKGSKLIGTPSVYKYNQNKTLAGTTTISNMEWDSYSLIGNDASYDIAGVINATLPFQLNPGENKNIQLVLATSSPQSLLVFVNDASGNPLDGAQITLTPQSGGQALVQITGQENIDAGCMPVGQVFFRGIASGAYDISISKSGYQTYISTVAATSSWVTTSAILNAQ